MAVYDNQFETKENYLNKGEKLSHNRSVVKLNTGSTDRPDGQTDGRARRMDRQTDKLDRRTNRHTDEQNGWTEKSDWSEGPGGLVGRTDDGPDLRMDPYSFRIDRIF